MSIVYEMGVYPCLAGRQVNHPAGIRRLADGFTPALSLMDKRRKTVSLLL
ncbi:MAG: hypothetical protein UW37_C0016G0002 [Candidatus Gottesmanbacteria bacterium GW2011_GWA2_44_17]|uniref:Uncharacterized protein n=1 Tax=Candidatus Gottesmanbacteria bacterium GW2011_GWA2_44_17 TaxID=1618444 RepID=A0A0G1HI10_9BACT|nr:MAG: hypothetical protein UW37_C0016G0002 [Candidatus Gottesmanbacteria bacterium GW2011_GWA2_44_17]